MFVTKTESGSSSTELDDSSLSLEREDVDGTSYEELEIEETEYIERELVDGIPSVIKSDVELCVETELRLDSVEYELELELELVEYSGIETE